MVKIAVISDTHFGFGRGTEREKDAFDAVEEAVLRAKEEECDLILHPGDMFDTKIPRPEEWAHTLRIFSKAEIPIIAIHGNHDRRGKGMINPTQGLSSSGLIKYLHCEHKTLEIDGKKIAVHGMGWVPESYAKDVMKNWNPQPVEDAFNILIMHQSIDPFVFSPLDPPTLNLENMPPGFDLYIDGHIHEHQTATSHGKPFYIAGSTVTTQVNKEESENPKCFTIIELEDELKIRKVELQSSRKVFYKEIDLTGKTVSQVREEAENFMKQNLSQSFGKKPLMRIRIVGSVERGESVGVADFKDIKERYEEKAIISVGTKISEEEFEEKASMLREMREKRLSPEEVGFAFLRESLEEEDVDFRFQDVFELLADGELEKAEKLLLGQET